MQVYRTQDTVVATATISSWTRAGHSSTSELPIRLAWLPTGPLPAPGTSLQVSGRLGPGEPLRRSAAYLAADAVSVRVDAPALQQGAQLLRESLRRSASEVEGDGGALLPGLVLGDTSAVSDELTQAMRDSGLAHLTAVSGGNVAVTLGLVWWVARRAGARRRGQLLLGAVLLPAYVVLVRPEPRSYQHHVRRQQHAPSTSWPRRRAPARRAIHHTRPRYGDVAAGPP